MSNDRFEWILHVTNVKPESKVLEIGCGVGLAVECIASTLTTGKITAIDRSPSMIDKASKRNQKFIEEGKAEFHHSDLLQFRTNQTFDIIFCFNINFFWTQKSIAREVEVIKQHLSPKGRLYIFYGPTPGGGVTKMKDNVLGNLKQERFKVLGFVEESKNRCCYFKAAAD